MKNEVQLDLEFKQEKINKYENRDNIPDTSLTFPFSVNRSFIISS